MYVHFDIVFAVEMLPHFKLNTSTFSPCYFEKIITCNHIFGSNITVTSIRSRRFFSVLGQNISHITKIYTVSKFVLFCYYVL